MKKLLFVCNGLYGGGAERVVARLSKYFANSGFEVFIAAIKTDRRYDIDKLVQIKQLSKGYFGCIKSLKNICQEIQPNIMIAMGTFFNYCAILSKNKGCIVIGSERTDPSVSGKGFFKQHFRNLMYRFADHLVFQTPDALSYFPRKIKKLGTVIPNPVTSDLPKPFKGPRVAKVVNFCRLTNAKNLPLLFESFLVFHSSHPEFKLDIYGDGPLREMLQVIIEKNGASDIIVLHPNQENVLEVVKDAAMFVSSSSFEGLSNTMIESMAIGLPTICTDCPCGGAKMIINDGVNGILVPNGDKLALVKAMTRIADDKELAVRLSVNAVKIRETLSIEMIAKMWEKLF